ncbi:beta-ketoacyl-ACP synthase III [Cytobacillus gottheilii]|uniref:Beta-ketoacyl-ACP synthase III n=1 Tax=Cytobacillus gottheilii TaxID=859144 RepID=A0ABX8F9E2_9BACI|nr:beta-ketoacyl-ACP synthase III [Cytobacillus gottheilii]QVY59772.1 beta-ketoacyl-ACP synthase III [Cytobacillus gottheilii]
MARKVKITGIGIYLPKRIVTASEIDMLIGAAPGWSEAKSGVKQRHFIIDETASFMGAEAAKMALKHAGMSLDDIDCIVSGSGTMEQAIPCNAALIQKELGLEHSGVPAFDINSTCLGFVAALDVISYMIDAGKYKNVLIINSEISSVGLNWRQDESSVLFGDGATAAIITKSEGSSCILTSRMETYSAGAAFSEIRGGGTKVHPRHYSEETKADYLFDMDGKAIFKMSSKLMNPFIEKLFTGTGLEMKDINMVIPHQASWAAMKIIRKKLKVEEPRFMSIIENYGNMISASIPLALYEAIKVKRIQRGDRILLLGTSAGLSIGGMVLEY